jgi:type IV secretory pathway VirJ component
LSIVRDDGRRVARFPTALALLVVLLSGCAATRGSDVPLVVRPVPEARAGYLVLFLTGDGGWRKIDATIARRLNAAGVPVVGFLSNRYFRRPYDPDQFARDVERVLAQQTADTGVSRVLLAGYSRGADAIPVLLARMKPESRRHVVGAVLLGPSRRSRLRVGRGARAAPRIDIAGESAHIGGMPLLCVQGTRERDGLCEVLGPRAEQLRFAGSHHFGGRYVEIADAILSFAARSMRDE